ncbi:MAG: hypothetical protein HJJLKODD_02037 [Phycisphaerae bacterium]|nr:hypothetical protein [Phycisphaerae bacterium]
MSQELNQHLLQFITQMRELIQLYVPREHLPAGLWFAVTLLSAGALLSVFGSSYARGILSAAAGGLGFLVGAQIAQHYALNMVAGGIGGFVFLALLGYLFHRFWVGLAVALVCAAAGSAFYAHQPLLSELKTYEQTRRGFVSEEQTVFTIPTVAENESYKNPTLRSYLTGFYTQFKLHQPQVEQRGLWIVLGGLVIGFALGVTLTRLALILSCALVGMTVLYTGLTVLAERYAPTGWEQNLVQHPLVTLGFLAAGYLLSMLIQFRLTQPPPKPAPAPA